MKHTQRIIYKDNTGYEKPLRITKELQMIYTTDTLDNRLEKTKRKLKEIKEKEALA